MDLNTFFSIIVTLFTSYATIIVSLLIARNEKNSLSIRPIAVVLTAVYLFITLITIVLCFGDIPFSQDVILKMQFPLHINETNFVCERFGWIYRLGLVPLLVFGVTCLWYFVYIFASAIIKVVAVLFNIIAIIIVPYFVSSFIYQNVYDFSFAATVFLNLLANSLAGVLLVGANKVLDVIDDIIM